MKTARLTKYQFKICEAVHLGLDYYYMAKNDRRTLTKEDYELAKRTLPTLHDGWYREPQEWSLRSIKKEKTNDRNRHRNQRRKTVVHYG